MIFYFSGTGNSKWIAQQLAQVQQEELISIAAELQQKDNPFRYQLRNNEKIGFVFPIYSWGIPPIVLEFIRKIDLVEYHHHYLFFVCSCGDDIGLAKEMFIKSVHRKGWECQSGFSVIMPNNYVLMKGFDTDSKEVEQRKLEEAVPTVTEINDLLAKRVQNTFHCVKGKFAYVKTRLIYPLFVKYQITAKPFYATDDCIACKLREKACPVKNIKVDGKPIWSNNCTSCLACYHICPRQAIQYGKETRGKGQYFNPNVRI